MTIASPSAAAAADKQKPSSSSSPSTPPVVSPTTVRAAATSLGTGSAMAALVMESNNTTNSSLIRVMSKIVIDTPPTLDKTSIDALIPGGDDGDKKYRMVAFDLDGTLLNSSHKLSDETKAHVRYLAMDCGFTIVFATGRAISTVYEHVLDLNLPPDLCIPVVSSNGACAFECRVDANGCINSKPLFATPVPEPVARKTIQLARKYGHCSQYYVGDEILADPIITAQQDTTSTSPPSTTTTSYYRSHLQLTQLYKDLTGAQTVYLPHDEHFENVCIDKGLPSKQLVLFPPLLQDEMMAVFEREMKQDDLIAASTATLDDNDNIDNPTATTPLKSAATIVRGNLGWFLEILHPSVCKGLGLQRLVREHLSSVGTDTDNNNINMDMQDCIAFGDGDNDVEFLQMAGLGIVMLNGRKVAKQAADCITTKCHDMNGVVTTLQLLEEHGKLNFPKKPSPSSKSSLLLPAKASSSTETTSLSTASLSSTSTSSLSNNYVVTTAALQVDDNNENNTDTTLDSSDTVEF